MFEIYKRHTPKFVTAEVKRVAQVLTRALGFDELNFSGAAIEITPIFLTARINEENEFLFKSELSWEEITRRLKEEPTLERLRSADPTSLIERVVRTAVEQLGVDSYLPVGNGKPHARIPSLLPEVTETSEKPLIVFTDNSSFGSGPEMIRRAKWVDRDHLALWLGELPSDLAETEAFFAVRPTLKKETALNRYKTLESFGTFALGMIRF